EPQGNARQQRRSASHNKVCGFARLFLTATAFYPHGKSQKSANQHTQHVRCFKLLWPKADGVGSKQIQNCIVKHFLPLSSFVRCPYQTAGTRFSRNFFAPYYSTICVQSQYRFFVYAAKYGIFSFL